jgi:Alr-MurF fusion protein
MKTIEISTSNLTSVVGGDVLQSEHSDIIIKQLIIDSRKLMAPTGAVFFAIDGKHHDGHQHIEDLYNKGVRIFIVEKSISNSCVTSLREL